MRLPDCHLVWIPHWATTSPFLLWKKSNAQVLIAIGIPTDITWFKFRTANGFVLVFRILPEFTAFLINAVKSKKCIFISFEDLASRFFLNRERTNRFFIIYSFRNIVRVWQPTLTLYQSKKRYQQRYLDFSEFMNH